MGSPNQSARLPLTRAEWGVVALFVIVSFEVFGLNIANAAAGHRVYLGAAGAPNNSLQYLAWATDAAHHGLIANLYGFHNGGHVYFNPIWLLTGLLHVDVGVPYVVLLGLWQALTLVLLIVLLRRYVARVLGGGAWSRMIALTLALFLVSPFFPFLSYLRGEISGQWTWPLNGESYAAEWISGDFPLGLSIVAMVAYVVLLERLLQDEDRPRPRDELLCPAGIAAALLGAMAALQHPWQGTELALMTVGIGVWRGPFTRRNLRLLVPLGSIALPLVYYLLLPHFDAGWARADAPGGPAITPLGWLTTFGPALLASIPGWRMPDQSDRQRLVRLWLIAVAVTFIASPNGRYEAFAGVSIPLAILTVQGWRRMLQMRRPEAHRRHALRLLAAVGVAVLVLSAVPETTYLVTTLRKGGQKVAQLATADADALDYLAHQPRGGVVTTANVGLWVPALTDDSTYVGHPVWTPGWGRRSRTANALFGFSTKLAAGTALSLIEQPAVRYVLEPCGARAPLGPLLEAHGYRRRGFGCATLYSRG